MNARHRGFSIAETLVGIFLVALLILVVFNLFPTTVLANRKGTDKLQAATLAQSVLSEARTRPFEDLVIGSEFPGTERTIEGVKYSSVYRVTRAEGSASELLRVIEVVVSWDSPTGPRTLKDKIWIHKNIEE